MPQLGLNKSEIEQILLDIYMGKVNVKNLPKKLYYATAKKLKEGLYDGYGGDLNSFEFGTPDRILLNELRTNTYVFSGAKTYTQYKEINSLMTEGNTLLKYKDFKVKALNVFKDYNETYLATEYETAVTSATTAVKFKRVMEHSSVLKYLRYSAVIDERTTEICRALDGTTLNANDKFWHTHVPPQHFNCRCIIESLDRYDNPELTAHSDVVKLDEYLNKEVQPVFKMNPALDKYIFSPKHPYFDIAPQDKALAERNFGFTIPKKDK